MLPLMAAGLLTLFPALRRSEITFHYEIDDPRCVERVDLSVYEGDVLARAHRELLEGRSTMKHAAKLKHGEFRAIIGFDCRDGAHETVLKQPIVVDRDGVIDFKLSGRECRCSEG